MTKKLIVIGGPTASGKTSLAIKIAQHFNTQILSADSRQCYRELNIGVAKPSDTELNVVPHHFINSHSIHEEVTAGSYERFGLETLENIFQKNDVAVCVGGTGLYIKALCEGMDDVPPVDKKISEQVEKEYEEKGLAWLQAETQKLDPAYFEKADNANFMRLLRALVFYKSHNQSILNFLGKGGAPRNFEIDYYAIDMPRPQLYDRINLRVEEMMKRGLLLEVKSLSPHKSIKALQTVGYKELFLYLDEVYTLEKAVEKIKQHTRNYAKRQITWFKNQGDFNFGTAESIWQEVKN